MLGFGYREACKSTVPDQQRSPNPAPKMYITKETK